MGQGGGKVGGEGQGRGYEVLRREEDEDTTCVLRREGGTIACTAR